MAQSSVSTDNATGYEGREPFPNVPAERMSKSVGETNGIYFGRAAILVSDLLYRPRSNQATIVLAGDLITANSSAVSIVVNGVTTVLTATVFASNHLTTMGAIATKLEAVSGVLSATVGGSNNRTITILADPETDIYVSVFTVTLGDTQTTATLANTCTSDPFGVTKHVQAEPDANGNVFYRDQDTASVLRDAYIEMVSDDALAVGDSVFFRFYDESATADKCSGQLMGSAGTSGGITRAKAWAAASVYEGCSAGGRAIIRVRI